MQNGFGIQTIPLSDSYGDFTDTINYSNGNVKIHLSCDGYYTLYINNKFVNANQYGDYEDLLKTNIAYKKNIIYEIRNIYKPMLKNETNTIWEVAEGEKALIKPAVCVLVGVLYPFYIYKNTRNL